MSETSEVLEQLVKNEETQVEQRTKQLFDLRLTIYELIHIRDLFGIKMPSTLESTISQMLAQYENRSYIEANLWTKISTLCDSANIALGDESPDFTIAIAAPPELKVVEIAPDPNYGGIKEESCSETD